MIVKTAREELIRFKGKAIGLGVFSLLGTLGIVGQAWFFAVLLEKTIFEGLPLDEVWSTVTWLIASVVLRMVATYCRSKRRAVWRSWPNKICAKKFGIIYYV